MLVPRFIQFFTKYYNVQDFRKLILLKLPITSIIRVIFYETSIGGVLVPVASPELIASRSVLCPIFL